MSERIKMLFMQFLMITTGIVGVMSLEGIFYHLLGDTFYIQWYQLISILLAAVLCTVPSLFLTGFENWPKTKFVVQLSIHCLVLYAIVAGIGYLFKWYSTLSGFLCVTIGYFLVYVFVWIATIWLSKREANEINAALDSIRDEE